MSIENSKLQKNSLALSLLKVYKSNRSLLLNTSYIILLTAAFAGATNTGKTSSSSRPSNKEDSQDEKELKKKSHKLSKESFNRLARAILPSFLDKSIFYLLANLVLLVVRALLTIKVATLDGQLVGALVSKRLKLFGRYLAYWMLLGIPAAFTNALLNWTKQNLSKTIRTNLNKNIMEEYLPDSLDANYYSLMHLSGNKIKDPNQRITTDVSRLSYALASLPGQLLKPTLI